MRLAFLLIALTASFASAANWYAAPDVSRTAGNGSIGSPFNLFRAFLDTTNIVAGDTLYLRNGEYKGPGFISTLTGTAESYITVRSFPGEWAVLTDGMAVTLGEDIDSSTNQAAFTGAENWSAGLQMIIDREMVQVDVIAQSPARWRINRGWYGTTATSHTAGTSVVNANHHLLVKGSCVVYRDFEVTMRYNTNRVTGFPQPIELPSNWQGGGVYGTAEGHGNKLVNLIIHDVGQPGIGWFGQGADSEIHGCLIFNCGEYDWTENFTGNPRGSGIYGQNFSGLSTVKNIITFKNMTAGAKVFGETGPVKDYQYLANIAFANGITPLEAVSGSSHVEDILFDGNVMMGTPALAYQSIGNTRETVRNNLIVNGGLIVTEFTYATYTNNTVFLRYGTDYVQNYNDNIELQDLHNTWDFNTYFMSTPATPYHWSFRIQTNGVPTTRTNASGGGLLAFSGVNSWRSWSLYDSNSTASAWPNDYLQVKATPNDYDANRWHISVVSTSGGTNATINLASLGIGPGQRYRIRDAQNYFVPILTNAYTSGTINLPLNLTNVSPILGLAANGNPMTNRHTNLDYPGLFNAFVLERLGDTSVQWRRNGGLRGFGL